MTTTHPLTIACPHCEEELEVLVTLHYHKGYRATQESPGEPDSLEAEIPEHEYPVKCPACGPYTAERQQQLRQLIDAKVADTDWYVGLIELDRHFGGPDTLEEHRGER